MQNPDIAPEALKYLLLIRMKFPEAFWLADAAEFWILLPVCHSKVNGFATAIGMSFEDPLPVQQVGAKPSVCLPSKFRPLGDWRRNAFLVISRPNCGAGGVIPNVDDAGRQKARMGGEACGGANDGHRNAEDDSRSQSHSTDTSSQLSGAPAVFFKRCKCCSP
jgi:hypothetical protein